MNEDREGRHACFIFLRIAWTLEGLETAFSASACPLPMANCGVKGDGPGTASDESDLLVVVNPCHGK